MITLRQFLASIGLAPLALTHPPRVEAKPEPTPDVQVFRYQTPRGRPWLQFVIKGKKRVWFYWAFTNEMDPKLPPGGRYEKPWYDIWGWTRFDGIDPEICLGSLSPSIRLDFPDYSRLEAYIQHEAYFHD